MRCLYEPTLKVEQTKRVYLPDSPSQVALYARNKVVRLRRLSVYTYPIRLVNSRCLHKTTLRVEANDHVNLPSPPSQLVLFVPDNLTVEQVDRVYLTSVYTQVRLVHSRFSCDVSVYILKFS